MALRQLNRRCGHLGASTTARIQVLPLEQLEAMHRSAGVTPQPAAALPWIHLYAGTLLVLVIVPRLLRAGVGLMRGRWLFHPGRGR
jgi:hypothetical protein